MKAEAVGSAENLQDIRIGVLQGKLGVNWVPNTLMPSVEVSQFQGQPEMTAALMSDQVDAIMTDTTRQQTATLRTNGAPDVVRQFNTGWGVNVITQDGLAKTPAMDAAMGAMVVDGP